MITFMDRFMGLYINFTISIFMQECPKCHQMIGKGFYQHVKWCDGTPKPRTVNEPVIKEPVSFSEPSSKNEIRGFNSTIEIIASKVESLESKLESKTDEIENKTEKIEANLNDLASIQGVTFVDDAEVQEPETEPEPEYKPGIIDGVKSVLSGAAKVAIVLIVVGGLVYLGLKYMANKAVSSSS
jgi:hypothetical protein